MLNNWLILFSVTDTTFANYTPSVSNSNYLQLIAVANGNVFDIYDILSGKIASVPIIKQTSFSSSVQILYVSNSWVSLYSNLDTIRIAGTLRGKTSFRLYNSTTLELSDTSSVYPCFWGGTNCYLISVNANGANKPNIYKIWKIGTVPGTIMPFVKPKQFL